ncbi:Serine/threonine-protein kinase F [compost metagenome]
MDTLQLGTIGFAAPEQYTLGQSDQRTDLYALGAVMYYLLSGGRTLHAAEPLEVSAGSRISKRTRNIIKRLLMYEREARYQSAGETRAELEAAVRAEGGSLLRTLGAWRRR